MRYFSYFRFQRLAEIYYFAMNYINMPIVKILIKLLNTYFTVEHQHFLGRWKLLYYIFILQENKLYNLKIKFKN